MAEEDDNSAATQVIESAKRDFEGHMEAVRTSWAEYNAPPVECEDYSPFSIESVKVSEPKAVPTGYGTTVISVNVMPTVHQADGLPYNPDSVARTASHFVWLRSELVVEFPGMIVPPVPRFCLAVTASEKDEDPQTAVALETFLKRILNKDLKDSISFKTFCLAKTPAELETYKKVHAPTATTEVDYTTKFYKATEAAHEALGTKRSDDKHVIASADDEEIARMSEWVATMSSQLQSVATKAAAAEVSLQASAKQKATFTGSVALMAIAQDPTNQLNLQEMGQLGPEITKSAEGSMAVLRERVWDVLGYLAAIDEAIKARNDLKQLASAAKKNHFSVVDSRNTAEAHEQAVAAKLAAVEETKGFVPGADGNYGLSPEQLASAKEVFGMFDTDGSGQISASELGSAFEAMGKKLAPADMRKMLEKVDTDQSGEVSYTEFLSLVGPMIKEGGLVDSQQIMSASTDVLGDVAGLASTKATILALQAQSGVHSMLQAYNASDDDVAEASRAAEDVLATFERVNKRLVAEVADFQNFVDERLRQVLITYFTVEFGGAMRENSLLELVITRLGGDLKDIKASIGA